MKATEEETLSRFGTFTGLLLSHMVLKIANALIIFLFIFALFLLTAESG